MENHYVNHNRRILNEVASEQHKIWERERDVRALKRAKTDVAPIQGKRFTDFSKLRILLR